MMFGWKWLVAVAAIACLCSSADGQKRKGKLTPQRYVPIAKKLPAKVQEQLKDKERAIDFGVAQPSGGVKNLEELQKLLTDMGYEPVVEQEMDYKYLQVPTPAATVYAEFDAEYGRVWISGWLGKIEDPDAGDPATLLTMMGWNGPFAMFHYDTESQLLRCYTGLESNLVTKTSLRRRIDSVAAMHASAQQLWGTGQ